MLNWINESDWEYTSKAMFHRQHHPGGIATNLLMIFQHLPVSSIYVLSSSTMCFRFRRNADRNQFLTFHLVSIFHQHLT